MASAFLDDLEKYLPEAEDIHPVKLPVVVNENLPNDLPAGTPIEVGFRYEANGRLRIAVNVAGVDDNVTYEITRENNMSSEKLNEWKRIVTAAKR